ncbi:MAG: segregation/condensation protein A [Thermodesulfobacteriota bacterium]
MDSHTNPCLVKIEAFEGPLDLLLHLIKKNEVDIYDIPIALITEQYCDYLDMMRVLNLEVVGEYLVIASELGLIKSRMLVPQEILEDETQEVEDPREELVRMLLEYQRFKDASTDLSNREMVGRDVFVRDWEDPSLMNGINKQVAKGDVWLLIGAMREVLQRAKLHQHSGIQFELELVTLEEKIDEITRRLQRGKRVIFKDLFSPGSTRLTIIVTFLAILELVKKTVISVVQDGPFSEIELSYNGAV